MLLLTCPWSSQESGFAPPGTLDTSPIRLLRLNGIINVVPRLGLATGQMPGMHVGLGAAELDHAESITVLAQGSTGQTGSE